MTDVSNPSILESKIKCFHCGENCKQNAYVYNEHHFCCNGCKTVFEILEGSELSNYYNIEKAPGIKPIESIGDFEFLELPEVKKQIIQYEDDEIVHLKLRIPQMHCSSCIYLLEQLNQINKDIVSSRVNFQRKEITITVKKTANILNRTYHLLNKLGYTPQIQESTNNTSYSDSKTLLIKIGIAGFCFGNIMLLSFPEYISGKNIIDANFKGVFNYLIILLIIPVLTYSARDYFVAAYKNLRHRNLSIDVPVVLGISALFIRSIFEIFIGGEPGYFDSLAGFVFFLLIGKWFQTRTYENLSFDKSYHSFFPLAVLKKVGESFITTRIQDLKKGDIIKLRNQEVLPVNAQLLDHQAIFDYSFVTGESKTTLKKKKEMLFAGGKLTSATALFVVTDEFDSTFIQDIWNTSYTQQKEPSKLISIIDSVSRKFTITIIAMAIIGFFFWYFYGSLNKALEVFTAILIVACPCALAMAAPFTFGNASRILSKIQIYLNKSSIIEQFSKVKTLVFDKTGTLTQKDNTKIDYKGASIDNQTKQHIRSIVSCSIHPLSAILTTYLDPIAIETDNIKEYNEVAGQGFEAEIDANQYYIGSKSWLQNKSIEVNFNELDGRSRVFIGKNGKFIGCFELSNTYRDDILKNLEVLTLTYNIAIVSGDGNYEEQYLNETLHQNVKLLFNQSPEQKLQFIQSIQKQHSGGVMMLGDGINDAKALKESDIGIAITEDTGSFTPNSDVIMHADCLTILPNLLAFGKDCKKILYICMVVSIVYNLVGLGVAFLGLLSPLVAAILMPLSSITVVLIAVGLTNYFAKKRKIV